jgi:hypothetical protein
MLTLMERPEPEDRHVIGDDRLQPLLLADPLSNERTRAIVFYPPQVHLYRHGSESYGHSLSSAVPSPQ